MSGGYAAYDALDQAMMDDPMADFMNTEFDNGRIVTREGFTPAILNNAGSTPGALRGSSPSNMRPKSVNWPDDPENSNGSGILVDTNEWGEWGSATPGITPGDQAVRRLPQTEASAADDDDGTIPDGGEQQRAPPSPIAATGVPRGILSRAVSRAVQNTHSNNNRMGQSIQFDKTGFSDSAFHFDELEVPADETMGDQGSKYNNKYLEYRARQINRSRAPVTQNNRHARTDTISGSDEMLPPVYSTKLLSQGIQQYELINTGVNLHAAVAADEKRKSQEEYKQQLDLDKLRQIDQTRRPAPRLDPTIEKTGFLIGRQNLSTAESTPNKRKLAREYTRQLMEDSLMAPPGAEIARKEAVRRAITPKGFVYKPNTAQTRRDQQPTRIAHLERAQHKREELRRNREDVRSHIISNELSLAEIRKARSTVGGFSTFHMEREFDRSHGLRDSLDGQLGSTSSSHELGQSILKDTPF